MSDIFKKIKSIVTEDDEIELPNLSENLSKGDKDRPALEDVANIESEATPELRRSSDVDSFIETYFPEDEDDPLEDFADLPLPAFLTRGTVEGREEPLVKVSAGPPSVSENTVDEVPEDESHANDQIDTDLSDPFKFPEVEKENETGIDAKAELKDTGTLFEDTDSLRVYTPSLPHYAGAAVNAYEAGQSGISFLKTGTSLAVLFWIMTASAIAYGFFDLGLSWRNLQAIHIAGLALLIIAPAILIALSAYAFSQLSKISIKADSLERTAQSFLEPDKAVIDKAAALSDIIKNQVDIVDARLEHAIARMAQMDTVIQTRAAKIESLIEKSETSSVRIAEQFEADRNKVDASTLKLEDKLAALSKLVTDHSASLTQIIKVADQKVADARINAESTAAKMNAASELVRKNTIEATSALQSGHMEIEQLGEMIIVRSHELDNVYSKHAKDLSTMIEQLRDEQQNLGVSLEARLAKMQEVSVSAKASAESLTQASVSGRKTVVALAEASRITEDALRTRFTEMEKMVEYSNARAEDINQMATRRVQKSLALTRKEISRIESDMTTLQDRLNSQLEASMVPVTPPSMVPKPVSSTAAEPLPNTTSSNRLVSPTENTLPTQEIPKKTAVGRKEKPVRKRRRLRFQPLPTETAKLDADVEAQERVIDDLNIPLEETQPIGTDTSLGYENLEVDPAMAEAFFKDEDLAPVEFPDPDNIDQLNTLASDTDVKTEPSSNMSLLKAKPQTDIIEPIASATKKTKKRWSWRAQREAQNSNETASESDIEEQPALTNERQIIATLTGMGLAPGAIVDDGCIIEAANTRKAKGAGAMSLAVSNRLSDPVKHLRGALELNPELKSDARAFTSQFQIRLGAIENDREGIRTRLESDNGRAYLLCDAALHG